MGVGMFFEILFIVGIVALIFMEWRFYRALKNRHQCQRAPFGHWDSAGYWHPDYRIDLSPEYQQKENEERGYVCKRYAKTMGV